ncbi:TetR/AcrR family transcriptional regulator [Stigmatella sp. ncwal1]|uniref:TetR/AcrR family transcriptional regulator n=1 Tax=Stigmatella ashevillensis TaxID=2995309 RepID=A0ABT5D8V4_9BACT|nr:TetR/AcrR family transcriptional regulator [Stigmatella ashevillena]MDC0708691.1 TetR/AcrR family transcriptional regulator [Stigmatella ashevillena]
MGIVERRERQKTEVRTTILRVARELVVREGFEGLTMRKLAEAIEYSPAAIYLHFKSRDAIARALCLQGFEELLARLGPAAAEPIAVRRLRALAEAYVGFGLEQPETYRLLFMTDPEFTTDIFRSPEDAGGRAFQVLVQLVEALKSQGEVADTVRVIPLAEVLWGALHGLVSLKLTCPIFPTSSVEELVETLTGVCSSRSGTKAS